MKKLKSKPMTPLLESQLKTQAKRIRRAGEAAKIYNSTVGRIEGTVFSNRQDHGSNQS